MTEPSPDDIQLLRQAKSKAEKLLADLIHQGEELERTPPQIPADKLAQGKAAFNNTIASARRTLDSIDRALQLVDDPPPRGD